MKASKLKMRRINRDIYCFIILPHGLPFTLMYTHCKSQPEIGSYWWRGRGEKWPFFLSFFVGFFGVFLISGAE